MTMTVKDLIAELQDHDPDRVVIISKDAEGNGYSPLSCALTGAYRAETTWRGEVGLESLDEDDIASGYTEEDVLKGGVPALVLVPIS
jgi:hypothetical protein